MNTIKNRAHHYAVAHQQCGNGVALMRAYTAGALDERRRTTVFISGKVSGLEYYTAYAQFANAERILQQMGYHPINPMRLCKKHWSWLRCMIVCLWRIALCSKFHQLPNWEDSRGARIEYKWAKLLRKRIL